MSYHHNEPGAPLDESFARAAVEFSNKNASLESATADFGLTGANLQDRANRRSIRRGSPKALSCMVKLRAENKALRRQVLSLQIQSDILRVTLGMLSTTVGTYD
jgi:hypothetical protein